MKKLFHITIALAGLFLFASCQKEANPFDSKKTSLVTFNLELPHELQSKAISDGLSINELYYEVTWFNEDKDVYEMIVDTKDEMAGLSKEISFNLVHGLKYRIIFWAQNNTSEYGVDNLTSIEMNYDKTEGNNENRDAFYAVTTIKVLEEGANIHTITLKRPFAQLNFCANDLTQGLSFNGKKVSSLELIGSEITVTGLATSFNTVTGKGGGENGAEYTFKASNMVDDKLPGYESHDYISMNYILPLAVKSTVSVNAHFDLEISVEDNTTYKVSPSDYSNTTVTITPNWRTNIVGSLFTENGTITVELDPKYNATTTINQE